MIFNLWRRYPRRKPKESGWYLCELKNGFVTAPITVLYYEASNQKWIDKDRQSVFDGYVVYKCCRAPIQENHVCSDGMCVRDDVLGWKNLPKGKHK